MAVFCREFVRGTPLELLSRRKEDASMKFKAIIATAVMVFGVVPQVAAQSLASPAHAPEPLAGLVLGLGLIGLRFLRRR
jgi:hypothetical protein